MLTEVEVRLASDVDGGTIFELVHSSPAEIVDEMVRAYGPGGTLGIGGGWDLTVLALAMFLRGTDFDPATGRTPRRPRSSPPAAAAPGGPWSKPPGASVMTTSPRRSPLGYSISPRTPRGKKADERAALDRRIQGRTTCAI
jgi:hypothetical protein